MNFWSFQVHFIRLQIKEICNICILKYNIVNTILCFFKISNS